MPRRTKKADNDAAVLEGPKSNGMSQTALRGFVESFEAEQDAINEIMAKAVQACQPHKDQMKEIVKAVAEQGCAKKVFRTKMRERSYLRRAEAAPLILSDEQREEFNEISRKLGPLGEWARANAGL